MWAVVFIRGAEVGMSEMTLDRIIKAALMPDDELQCLIDVQAELKRLRGIEAAALQGESREEAIALLRQWGKDGPDVLGAIADTLESK